MFGLFPLPFKVNSFNVALRVLSCQTHVLHAAEVGDTEQLIHSLQGDL